MAVTARAGVALVEGGEIVDLNVLIDRVTEAIDAKFALREAHEAQLTNRSGAATALGTVMVIDRANPSSATTTITADSAEPVVVALEAAANLALVWTRVAGRVAKVNVIVGVVAGNYLSTSTTAGQAQGTAAKTSGTFAVALTTRDVNGQVDALILGGGGGGGGAAGGTDEHLHFVGM